MDITNFDLDFKKHIEKLCDLADKRFPNRSWFCEITLWTDTDFRISLKSSWGRRKDVYIYRKSNDEYKYERYETVMVKREGSIEQVKDEFVREEVIK